MVALSAHTAHRKLISARADVSVPRRGHQEDAGDGGATMVDGDQLGRHGFRLCGHGEIRDGGCCCCRHGNSNTLFCFEFDLLLLFPKTTCFQRNVAECEFGRSSRRFPGQIAPDLSVIS